MALEFRDDRSRPRIVFAPGLVARAHEELAGFDRVLVLCTSGRQQTAERLREGLGSRCAGIHADARAHVPRKSVEAALAIVREAKPDLLLSCGGGSAIGLAKAIAKTEQLSIACLPTTFAGSEMTSIYGISDEGGKTTGRDPAVLPSVVLYDPALLESLPRSVALTSAFNALAHAAEALYAPGLDPSTGALACAAIQNLSKAIVHIGGESLTANHWAQALLGAYQAGACLERTSMGLHHKLCHVLGGSFGLAHAQTHTIVLAHALAHNRDAAPEAMARIANALRVDDAAAGIFDLAEYAGVPTSLGALGLGIESLDAVIEQTLRHSYRNPAEVTADSLRTLLTAALSGQRPATPVPVPVRVEPFETMGGFGGSFESEARAGALPRRQNMPLPAPYGLYAELVNGSPFTAVREENRRAWLYRVRPSNQGRGYEPLPHARLCGSFEDASPDPSLARWSPLPIPQTPVDFVDGLATFGGNGTAGSGEGFAIHLYSASASMNGRSLTNVDGDLLIVPELGALHCRTELGWLRAAPGEILVIPAGLRFSMVLPEGRARGYVLEVFGRPFRLPERGPVGSNGLADNRHFRTSVAAFEHGDHPDFQNVVKNGGRLWAGTQAHSPWDVVAWHGNLVPYKYDLTKFQSFGSVSWDHPDPSILTVISAPIGGGRSLGDLVIFPGRWEVSEHSFRPPFFHRNAATEFNGIIHQPTPTHGFEAGCYFHTPMHTPHGIEAGAVNRAYEQAGAHSKKPTRLSDRSLWMQFESCLPVRTTKWALEAANRDPNFQALFQGVNPAPFVE